MSQNIGVVTRVHFGNVFKSYFSKSKQYSQDAWDFQKELQKKLLLTKWWGVKLIDNDFDDLFAVEVYWLFLSYSKFI